MKFRSRIISVGNSQWVRIPGLLLKQAGLENQIEMEVQHSKIVLHALQKARQDWDEAFAAMAKNKDDALLDREQLNEKDTREWVW